MTTKWGIIGTGNISQDFASVLKAKPEDHEIVAVAASTLEKAKKFAERFNIPQIYGSHESLANVPNIDIVYIGLVNTHHFETSSLMLKGGKNVLCEKPLCLNVKRTQFLLDLAFSKGLFLMEAIWSRFFPVYVKVREEIRRKELGDVIQVMATFGLEISHLPRIVKRDLGGGITLDIGIYLIQFALWIFDSERPQKIVAGGHIGKEGCDESMNIILTFSNNRTAVLSAHSKLKYPNTAFVYGTNGTIKIPDFWHPTEYESPSGKKSFELIEEFDTVYGGSCGLIYEANEVRRCLKEELLESPLMPHKETLMCAEIMQECLQQIGIVYET